MVGVYSLELYMSKNFASNFPEYFNRISNYTKWTINNIIEL